MPVPLVEVQLSGGFCAVARTKEERKEAGNVLRWALGFFVVALIAAIFGFTGIAVAAAGIAKTLFFVFLVLFLFSLMSHLLRRN